MSKIKEKPAKTKNIFESFFDFYHKNGHDKVFYPSSMHKAAEIEAIILIEKRKPGKPLKEEIDYIYKLREFIEDTWGGTEYKLEFEEIKLIKKNFDKKWLKAKKKIPHEYTAEYLNKNNN